MIIVCPLHHAHTQVAQHQVGQVISLLSPDMSHPHFPELATDHHLRLSFHDVGQAAEGLTAPQYHDIDKLISFIQSWDRKKPLLIHCWAGISRSPAAAFIALCLLFPSHSEEDLAQRLRHASALITPNRLLVALADQRLGREGRMVQAIATIGRGANAAEGSIALIALKPFK